ncbi:MAG: glycosyltransferase [Acidobacteriota bacterium]
MKLALVGPAPPIRGGISQYSSALYRTLCPDHEVLLVSFSRQYPQWMVRGHEQDDSGPAGVEVPSERILDSVSPSSWKAAGGRIADFGAEAVVFQWWHPFMAPCYLGVMRHLRRRSGQYVKALLFCHNLLSHEAGRAPGRRLLEGLLLKRVLKKSDGFVAHSEKLVGQLQAQAPGKPIRRVFHPLYDFYSQWDVPEQENAVPRLLFFGNVRAYKGLDTLLQAVARLPQDFDFRLIVAGEFFIDPKPCRRLARRLGVEGNITWIDRYIPNPEVPRLFRQADLVVLPYKAASQSGIVPLAYHFEVPVVATDVGGLSEVVLHGRTGYLAPPEDPQALADTIVRFFREGDREEFRHQIRDFRSQLSWEAVVDNILAVCGEIRTLERPS